MEPHAVGDRFIDRIRAWLVIGGFAVGLFAPSSIGGAISRPLTIVCLLTTCGMLGALAWLAPTRSVAARIAAVTIPMVLTGATLLSPSRVLLPGLATIYLVTSLLYLVDLRNLQFSRTQLRIAAALHIAIAVLGIGVVMDIHAVDRVLVSTYSGFYPTLVLKMTNEQRPVATFGTHSIAALATYLLFLTAFAAFERSRSRMWLVLAAVEVSLLLCLRSTTALILGALALARLLWFAVRTDAARAAGLAVTFALVLFLFFLAAKPSGLDVKDAVVYALGGSRARGLAARFGAEGSLARDLAYIREHPFRPIGVTRMQGLYAGDSGWVVNWLRGSLPIVVAIYGGLLAFLLWNLPVRLAVGLWVVIFAAEIAILPLQYFRFQLLLTFAAGWFASIQALPFTKAAPGDANRLSRP